MFPRPLGTEVGSPADVRDLHNIMLRHMILQEAPGGREGFPLLNVFDDRRGQSGGLRYPSLRVLQLLSARGGELRWGTIRDWFAQEGLDAETLTACLLKLCASRGWESEGLIRVDGIADLHDWHDAEHRAHPDQEPLLGSHRMVRLRSSGRLFMSTVVKSVEYLFWCALDAQRIDSDLLPFGRSDEISASDVDSDEFRARVALAFIEAEIEPAVVAEVYGQATAQERLELLDNDLAPAEFQNDFNLATACATVLLAFVRQAPTGAIENPALLISRADAVIRRMRRLGE